MNLTLELLPESWPVMANLLYGVIFILSMYYLPRRWFMQSYNIFFGFCVFLIFMWTIKAGIKPGQEYHFLGATMLTLLFGWQMAILGVSIVMLALVLHGDMQWQMYSMNMLVMGVVPVFISSMIYLLMDKKFYHHFIIYIFFGVFFNAAATLALTVIIATIIMVTGGGYTLAQISYDYLPYIAMMIYPEAFITGFVLIVMVIYFPQWVTTFDDNKYLKGK